MNIILKCGECGSTMDLNFKEIAVRAYRTNDLEITCQACQCTLNAAVSRKIASLIKDYMDYAPNWEFEFKLTPPATKVTQI